MTRQTPKGDTSGRPPTPMWVKVLAVVGLALVLVLLVGLVTGVSHGPGMHGG
jgi:hypothetical protein